VSVEDNGDGTLTCTAELSDGDVASFVNPFKPLAATAKLEGVKVLMDKDARSIGIPLANLSQEVRHHLALNAVKSEFCVFIFR
jgi:hypothetical protein